MRVGPSASSTTTSARGLDWVIKNRERYGIRIINMSVGGDYEASYLRRCAVAVGRTRRAEGILVCAAVGNAGQHPTHPVLPPASAPSVLTVGGLDDKNRLDFAGYDMYHSSYGPTMDGLQKPEMIAPGHLGGGADPARHSERRRQPAHRSRRRAGRDLRADRRAPGCRRRPGRRLGWTHISSASSSRCKLRDNNVISGAYKHVDGTSFAAPIVASVAAQMLEANPRLTARQARRILIGTAMRLPRVEVDRQGWGVISPRHAVETALGLSG